MISYTNYKDQLSEAMKMCNDAENSIFIGQQIVWKGNPMSTTLDFVDKSKMIEVPVMEETQMGMSLGMALEGYLPVSLYQRMDFLPRAMDQLVNHVDLLNKLSEGKFNPKIIIRTTIGVSGPLDIGLQHKKDLVEGFKAMLHFPVIRVTTIEEIAQAYKQARE